MDHFQHESSIVHSDARIGKGTRIWQFCCIMEDVYIGEACNIGAYVFLERGVRIGNRVKLKNNISVYQGVELEDDVFVGPNVVFTNVINPRSFIDRKNEFRKTIVERGASVGANATVICGHTIGRYAFVGAGTVVTKDVPPHALFVGNPGRIIGYVCECGEKMKYGMHGYACLSCGKQWNELPEMGETINRSREN